MVQIVLVRGAGDVGSAVAHTLFAAGYRLAVHDLPAPTYGRRGMAFVDAIFDGSAVLAGTLAKRARTSAIAHMLDFRQRLPISTHGFAGPLQASRPDVRGDSRSATRAVPERE